VAQIERRPGEDENAFRMRQKRVEVREYLDKAPVTVDEFVASPKWKLNNAKPPNLVFEHVLTIRGHKGGFSWVISGGKPTFGSDVFESREEAQRDLWDALQRIVSDE